MLATTVSAGAIGAGVLAGASLVTGIDLARWTYSKLKGVWNHFFGVDKDENGKVVDRGIFRYIYDNLILKINSLTIKVVKQFKGTPEPSLVLRIKQIISKVYIQVAHKLSPPNYKKWLETI